MKLKTKRAEIEIDTNLQDFYTGFLDTVAPNLKKVLDTTLQGIQKEAEKNWPVRKPEITFNNLGEEVIKKTTKDSWKMFERGFRIVEGGQIEAYLRNTAQYSWAIKFGENSQNNRKQQIIMPVGKRAATELMIKPQEKETDKVVKALADDLIKRL
tara:strand:+ start:240 stop:704 length:465 start_codon:yes stop_codon:yes gene_type:complete